MSSHQLGHLLLNSLPQPRSSAFPYDAISSPKELSRAPEYSNRHPRGSHVLEVCAELEEGSFPDVALRDHYLESETNSISVNRPDWEWTHTFGESVRSRPTVTRLKTKILASSKTFSVSTSFVYAPLHFPRESGTCFISTRFRADSIIINGLVPSLYCVRIVLLYDV